jgi:divalent metal cation (Fe/Co/Zn/Cd) transporter
MYALMRWDYGTLVPLWAAFVIAAALSNAAAMGAYAALTTISLVVQAFSLYAMRRVIVPNEFSLPWGAGKIEDFSAFLCGVLFVPAGLVMGYVGLLGLAQPRLPSYGLALIPLVYAAVRLVVLSVAAQRLLSATSRPSLLLRAYLFEYRSGALRDVAVLVSFLAAWLLERAGAPGTGRYADGALTTLLGIYAVVMGIMLVRRGFRPLMDLPLPEAEQMQIMKVLARHYRDYDDVGGLFARISGRQRFILIELTFPRGTALRDVERLRAAMEHELAAELPGLFFTICPGVTPE